MDHNKLIARKAKSALKPLEFIRSGKSRIWYKDNGWWSVVIEFQPSSHSKGTYVNVSVAHFLYEWAGWAFHVPKRLPGFASAEDDVDFESKVEKMAEEASELAVELLNKYQHIDEFIEWYSKEERRSIWDEYYSGVFSAIADRFDEAQMYFQKVCDNEYFNTWEKAVQHRSEELIFLLQDKQTFQSSMQGVVLRTRNLMCLDDYAHGEIEIPWA